MEAPLTEKEIEFCEHFYTPTSMTENLIPVNENAPHCWSDKEDCIYEYLYQEMMQNFSYLVANDPELTPQQNFNKRKGAGDCYSIGSRGTGKSFFIKIDVFLTWIHKVTEGCISSFDQKHLSKVTDPIASYIESHPFAKIFHLKKGATASVNRKHGGLRAVSEHGCLIESANEKVEGNNPGTDFHSKHFEILWIEEVSYISDEGTQKRVDAGSQLGVIERFSGIPDLRIGSPLTKLLHNKNISKKIWRLPQYVKPTWSDELKEDRILHYGGENSSAYKLNVEAEIIEGAEGFWDIDRLKEKCYNPKRKVKIFEISKESFAKFKSNIIVERMPGTEKVFICSDIGLGGSASQVIIIFKVGDKYKYVYNIPLFKLIQKEQAEVFKWLYDVLGGAFISIDATGDGGVINDYLFDMGVPQECLLKVKFNENIEIDFEKDPETGYVITDKNGQPVMKKMNTLDFAMQEMEKIFYEGMMEVPQDENFFEEFNGFYVKMVGTRKAYGSNTSDHKHQSFQVFSVCRYFNEFNELKSVQNQPRCYGVI